MTEGSRANLKRAIVSRLDSIAEEHRLGHQAAYANRYKMRSLHDALNRPGFTGEFLVQ